MQKQTVTLLVLSGFGIGRYNNSNPIYKAQPKNLNYIRLNYPAGALQASGIAVGLPWSEEGNPKVGYLTMGAGKVLYQDYPRISLSVKDGTFFENPQLKNAIQYAKEKGTKVNLVGMLGDGTSFSAYDHLEALIEMMQKEEVNFSLHMFAGDEDSGTKDFPRILTKLPQDKLSSISGMRYGMDQDFHWEKTKRAYDTITGQTTAIPPGTDISSTLKTLYEGGLTDDFINPMLIRQEGAIQDGDSVIFFNFREDSMRQLVNMFTDPNIGNPGDISIGQKVEPHHIPTDLHITTFTSYGNQFTFPVAFPSDRVINPLGKVISDSGKVQIRLAETEKYAYVTNLFNGMKEEPFPNEYRVLIPSRQEARVWEYPEMRISDVSDRVQAAIGEGVYDFILADFANGGAMAKTGNFDAAIKAIEAIDKEVGEIMEATLAANGILVITSDYGNIEVMMDVRTGMMDTRGNISPVPIFVVANGYERQKTEEQARAIEKVNTGVLSDIAPTILELMRLAKPQEMMGISLLRMLR